MSAAANTLFDGADDVIFDDFAVACTVTRGADPAVTTRCVIEDGIEVIGQYGQVVGTVTHASFIKTEWDPARADVVTIDGNARKVEKIDSDDGFVVRVVLNG